MNGFCARFVRLGLGVARRSVTGFCLAGLLLTGSLLSGQAAAPEHQPTHLTTDWSSNHLIFSRPATAEKLARVSQDPRYRQQIARRQMHIAPVMPAPATSAAPRADFGMGSFEPAAFSLETPRAEVSPRFAPSPIGRLPRPDPPQPGKPQPGAQLHRDWSEDLGPSASPGAGNYPAKFSFEVSSANCDSAPTPDYVVYSTGLSLTQASIVAYDNLYTGCTTGTVPSVYWAYDTLGDVLTSPVLSEDGSQVAFVQTLAGAASVVIVTWKKNALDTPASPETPLSVPAADYPASCITLPCMTSIALLDSGTPADDTTSSVFYDYADDIAWVGDSLGYLHKFHPFFKGAPTEVTTGFPIKVSNTGTALSGPVYDLVSGQVFVGDAVGTDTGSGSLYSVPAAGGSVVSSGQLDFGVGIGEGPVVDSSQGLVYVFASSDGTLLCNSDVNNCAGVYQLPASFLIGSTGTEAVVGVSNASTGTPNPLYIGGFDSAYINSANATGSLYVCGDTGENPTLYQIPITAGAMPASGTAANEVAALAPSNSTAACSPVTDFPNPNTTPPSERIFVSTQNDGTSTACASAGCIVNLISAPWTASTTYVVGQQILDSRQRIETVMTVSGTGPTLGLSGTTEPTWTGHATTKTTDNNVTWIQQGPTTFKTFANWTANTAYTAGTRIIDSNGDTEIVTVAGTSDGTPPAWGTIGSTTDEALPSTVVWKNIGPVPTFALAAPGGTSGIIIDNMVVSLGGASQVYFNTLNGGCGTLSADGCAVQASQTALQ